jgi:uncharacterized protein (UPF0335 family)
MSQVGRNSLAGELLRGFVERVENINEQIKALNDDKAVVMAEAKQANLIPAGVRYIVKKRKMKPSERAEAEAIEDMYLHAMGMAADNPLFRMVGLMNVDITAKQSVIDAMKDFVPAGGSIVIEAGGAPVRLVRDADGNVSVTEIVQQPVSQSAPGAKKAPPPRVAVPDVDGDGAEELGQRAFKADARVIDNPFPFGDPRRPRWDAGWRKAGGGDGMGPEE